MLKIAASVWGVKGCEGLSPANGRREGGLSGVKGLGPDKTTF